MNNVNKTLYIPLYGKAYVSKTGDCCYGRREHVFDDGRAL